VDPQRYLPALWAAVRRAAGQSCQVTWVHVPHGVASLQPLLGGQETVVLACAQDCNALWQTLYPPSSSSPSSSSSSAGGRDLPFTYVRGQQLHYRLCDIPPPPPPPAAGGDTPPACSSSSLPLGTRTAVISAEFPGYAVPHLHSGQLIYGATREFAPDAAEPKPGPHTCLSAPADLRQARCLLQAQQNQLYPHLSEIAPVGVSTGVRVQAQRSHLGRLPVLAEHPESDRAFLIAAFGSRGLLHHALWAKHLAQRIVSGSVALVPEDMRL